MQVDMLSRVQGLSATTAAAIGHCAEYLEAESTILIGSFARGDACMDSDVDLLFLTQAGRGLSALRRQLDRLELPNPISLIRYSPEVFREYWEQGSLFVFHVIEEGVVLEDGGWLDSLMEGGFALKGDFSGDIAEQFSLAEVIRDARGFQGHLVDASAHLYSIYKNVVFFSLAQLGSPIFNRGEAFGAFFQRFPQLAHHSRIVDSLWTCYRRAVRGETYACKSSPTEDGFACFLGAIEALAKEVS